MIPCPAVNGDATQALEKLADQVATDILHKEGRHRRGYCARCGLPVANCRNCPPGPYYWNPTEWNAARAKAWEHIHARSQVAANWAKVRRWVRADLDALGFKTGKHPKTLGELHKQWQAQARRSHPDRGGSTEDMQQVNAAYERMKKLFRRKAA